jgi:hypothetical protein
MPGRILRHYCVNILTPQAASPTEQKFLEVRCLRLRQYTDATSLFCNIHCFHASIYWRILGTRLRGKYRRIYCVTILPQQFQHASLFAYIIIYSRGSCHRASSSIAAFTLCAGGTIRRPLQPSSHV